MPDPLPALLDALRRERTDFLDALAALDEGTRTARPAHDAWSPVEIGEHIYRAEAAMLRGVEKQLAAGEARKDVGPYRRGALLLLLAAMRAPIRLTVPEAARGIVPEGIPYDALREAWAGLDARWSAAGSAVAPDLGSTPLIRHPLAGALTFADAVRFLAAHAARHRRQLDRAVRSFSA